MIRRNHGVELAAHRADKNSIRGERAGQPSFTRGRRKELLVFISEPPAVAGVRVEGTESNARLTDCEPITQAFARDAGGIRYYSGSQLLRNLA